MTLPTFTKERIEEQRGLDMVQVLKTRRALCRPCAVRLPARRVPSWSRVRQVAKWRAEIRSGK